MIKPRIVLARFLLQLGRFIQSLAVVVMKPRDLIAFSYQAYSRPESIVAFGDDGFVRSGLTQEELEMMKALPIRQGKLLILGVGGGREAIPLAKLGFEVTGMDFVPQLVDRAIENAARSGVQITGLVQELSQLEVPDNSYDVLWISLDMYSCIPTVKKRITFLQRVVRVLKPGGYFLCQFHWEPRETISRKAEAARKFIAWLSLGNLEYQPGDIIWQNLEYLHSFLAVRDIQFELDHSGMRIIKLYAPNEGTSRGWALLKKPEVMSSISPSEELIECKSL